MNIHAFVEFVHLVVKEKECFELSNGLCSSEKTLKSDFYIIWTNFVAVYKVSSSFFLYLKVK